MQKDSIDFNTSPLISIGMPVFNGEKYIKEALDSLLSQNLIDFEVIISDNSSSDGTQNICEEYAARDSRIRYSRQDKNIGVIRNFRYVLDRSEAEYFMWLAYDDYLGDGDYLLRLYSSLGGHNFCFPRIDILNMDGEGSYILENVTENFEKCKSGFDFCKQTVNICSYQIYGLYKKSFLLKNYHFIDSCSHMKCYGEGLAVHAMTVISPPCYEPNVRLIYRRHNENVSSASNGKHYKDFFEFTIKVVAFYGKKTNFNCRRKLSIIKDICFLYVKKMLILLFPRLFKLKKYLKR